MRTRIFCAALLLGSTASARSQTAEAPAIDNWRELRAAFAACWTPPADTQGSMITIQFPIARDGGLRDDPRVIGGRLLGSPQQQQLFRRSALDALQRCLPLPLTEGFRAVVMGDAPIRLRFANTAPEPALQDGPWMTVFASDETKGASIPTHR